MPYRRPPRKSDALHSDQPSSRRAFSRAGSALFRRLLARFSSGIGSGTTLDYGMEVLEARRMLVGTVLNDYGTGAPQFYDYFSGQDQIIQIAYFDVNATATAALVNPTTGQGSLGALPPAGTPEPALGGNIYNITVTQSNADSYISIYQIVSLATDTPEPFNGAIPQAAVNGTTGPHTLTVPTGTGGVFIGAIDSIPTPGPVEITSIDGVTPGITVIPINAATDTPNNFGNFIVAGTVTGSVSFGGNLNEFYAGSVLTGDVNGGSLSTESSVRPEANTFTVAGDLREFITAGPVGTDGTGTAQTPAYVTNFDLSVGGKIGEIHIGNNESGTTAASFEGTIEAGNSPYISQQTPYPTVSTANLIGNTTDQTEVENLAPIAVDVFEQGQVNLRNDTAADAQILGSIPVMNPDTKVPERDHDGNIIYQASVDGNLDTTDGDVSDFYAVPMLAGTTFTVSLSANDLAVIDPDGREIATNTLSGIGEQQITADRPGLYTFEVSGVGGAYTLTVSNVGDMGIGGIETTANFGDTGIDSGVICGNGDLGALVVGETNTDATYYSRTTGPTPTPQGSTNPGSVLAPLHSPTSILVASGNLRALIGWQIGQEVTGSTAVAEVLEGGPTLAVPNGSVGLVESTGAVVNLNCQFDPNYTNAGVNKTDDLYASAIGGFIQKIEAATAFGGNIATNGGIGTIEAGNMATVTPSFIDVNADNVGQDGIIDLIDVSGNFGTLSSGGPQFMTNTGGDIRYMNLLGNVYRDEFFGGGLDNAVLYPAGQPVTFTEQTGIQVTATPIGPTTTTTVTATTVFPSNSSTGASTNTSSTTSTTTTTGPQIRLGTYQIRDKGGLAIVSVACIGGSLTLTANGTSTGTDAINVAQLAITGTGVPITDNGTDQFGNTEITQASPTFTASNTSGTATTTTTNADGSITTTTTTTTGGGTSTQLSAVLSGTAKINVLDLIAEGDATLLENNTTGEVAGVDAPDVGQILVHGNLGYTTPVATAAAVNPSTIIAGGDDYPFDQQHTGVVITGSAVAIDAYGGIGNVNVYLTIGSLVANYAVSEGFTGVSPIPNQFSGINGPIVAGEIDLPAVATFGTIISIDIGQGVLPSGTGAVGYSGIYASGAIGLITNMGNPSADIRGNVVSEDDRNFNVSEATYVTGNAIGEIFLKNASIIDSRIYTVSNITGSEFIDNFGVSSDVGTAFVSPEPAEEPFDSPYIYEIGSIDVSGTGGIIGADIECTNVGPINVYGGGFGVLSTTISSQDIGRIAGITASGYGIRDTSITDDGYVGPIVASGSGALLSVLNYPIDVRESDVTGQALDPFFGVTPSPDIDLDAELGVTSLDPNIADVTDTGVVQDCVFEGQESFAGLAAQKVRTAEPLFTPNTLPTPTIVNIPAVGVDFPMEINFGNSVGTIRVYQSVDGLQITTGHLIGFHPSGDVSRLGISVNGPINALVINGNLGQYYTDPNTGQLVPDSYVNAGGKAGRIGLLKVIGDMNANIYATAQIGSILVTGDLLGAVIAYGSNTSLSLGSLHVFGGIRDGSLELAGSVGSIIVNGSFGTSGGKIGITGSVNLISVGAAHIIGSQLALALSVGGNLGTLRVFGQITGSVRTGGNLNHLSVISDGTASDIVSGNITVEGRLGTARIIDGSVSSTVDVVGSIGSFLIDNGDLLSSATVESEIDAIRSFSIVGGPQFGLFGSLLAPSGLGDRISISGNIGDGTDPAQVTAGSGSTFFIRGTIENNAAIAVTSGLNLLQVEGNVLTGAVISAHPLKKQIIKGSNTGTITIT